MSRLTYGLLFLFGISNGDTYMHNPRGSNNRLNEKSANRNNANRLCDTQNNNRGGYNVAETGITQQGFQVDNNDFGEGTPANMYDVTQSPVRKQYDLAYQEGSQLRWTWTSQHGCGNAMNNCNMLLQFTCDTSDKDSDFDDATRQGMGTRVMLHNGGNTNTPQATNNFENNNIQTTFTNNNGANRGRHEPEEFYALCQRRERNKGLFTADQKLNGHAQKNTRQNPNGARSGLECPEERDYHPWWFPSPWIDIVNLSNDVEYCKEKIAPFSQNVSPKGTCTGGDADTLPDNDQAAATTKEACEENGTNGVWVETTPIRADNEAWADEFCQGANWSQVNHLGNVEGSSLGGQTDNYMWNIPTAAELESYGCHKYTAETPDEDESELEYFRLVVRQRYNISTMDYDPFQTFADQNNDPKNGVISPVTQNPTIDVGAYMQGLRLALNTAQTGRTFQDRSHVFSVYKKVGNSGATQNTAALLNVNVRGKRGNIVQTFPAVEYDFEPNDFVMSKDQCIHLQWAGSNTHNNGNPAGDGQAGDAGEGAGGSDRSNIMEMKSLRNSFPIPYDKNEGDSFFDQVDCKYPFQSALLDDGNDQTLDANMVKAILATGGYYYYDKDNDELNSVETDEVQVLMNNVSAAFKQGLICCTNSNTKTGDYYFLSTRNNNFTNRAQKMKIRIESGTAQAFEFYKKASA